MNQPVLKRLNIRSNGGIYIKRVPRGATTHIWQHYGDTRNPVCRPAQMSPVWM